MAFPTYSLSLPTQFFLQVPPVNGTWLPAINISVAKTNPFTWDNGDNLMVITSLPVTIP